MPEFEIYRNDRTNNNEGGVMIAVKNNLKSEIFPTKENKQIETIYCKIKLNDKPKQEMIVGSIYRPSNHNIQTSKEICEELADIRSDNSKAHF